MKLNGRGSRTLFLQDRRQAFHWLRWVVSPQSYESCGYMRILQAALTRVCTQLFIAITTVSQLVLRSHSTLYLDAPMTPNTRRHSQSEQSLGLAHQVMFANKLP